MSDEQDRGFQLLRSIRARDLLSFGPEGVDLDLPALTVLIGPNGSGKSNLFEALGLLHASPSQLARPVRDGGGIRNWLWNRGRDATARIEAVVEYPKGRHALRHVLEFGEADQTFRLVDERVENEKPYSGDREPYFFYRCSVAAARQSPDTDPPPPCPARPRTCRRQLVGEYAARPCGSPPARSWTPG